MATVIGMASMASMPVVGVGAADVAAAPRLLSGVRVCGQWFRAVVVLVARHDVRSRRLW
ncbi:MAG TPA: hypothetical protein VFL94_04630 [Actinomycetales bacterium]|nr:hypothetical protein [Actinomycetales bacterium]